ncbi:hypothetical protein NQ318_011051, partial [Aromia moschata]
MLSCQMEQRVYLKFLVKLRKTFTEAYAMLKEVYGNECICAKFDTYMNVPKLLTPEQKELRRKTNICADILNNIDLEPGLFESVEAVKAKTTEVLNQLTEADFQHWSPQWKSRMERCRKRQGEYIVGEKVATLI